MTRKVNNEFYSYTTGLESGQLPTSQGIKQMFILSPFLFIYIIMEWVSNGMWKKNAETTIGCRQP